MISKTMKKSYFNYLENAIRLSRLVDELEIFTPEEYFKDIKSKTYRMETVIEELEKFMQMIRI